VRIYGLDFTSAPSRRKPLIALGCTLSDGVLRVESAEEMTDFAGFEAFLGRPGPWVCGMDFPFGQPRSLVSALGWPANWEGYVGEVARLRKDEFEDAIRADMALRPAGSKYRYRGAPRLLQAGVRVEPCRREKEERVAVEAYPAVVARRFLGRASYKNDERRKQTEVHRSARATLVAGLRSETLGQAYGFVVETDRSLERELVRDPAADALDSLLCAVQAAWAHTMKDQKYGVPPECDPNEGWILDPGLLADGEA
jgi:hypothetical protein